MDEASIYAHICYSGDHTCLGTGNKVSICLRYTATDCWKRIYNFCTTKSPEDRLTDKLLKASSYREWWQAAVALDNLPSRYNWRINPIDNLYDYRHLDERRRELRALRRNDKAIEVANYLRHGLLRNLFNITKFPLYSKSYTSTKESVEGYVEESLEAIRYIVESQDVADGNGMDRNMKIQVLSDSRTTFGTTALLLQGGSLFGLCHLGVVKALLEHDLLPKVIVGTATGALMAALVGIHPQHELQKFLSGEYVDLSAFADSSRKAREKTDEHIELLEDPPPKTKFHNWYNTLERRMLRLFEKGFILDPEVLAECVKANVGDLTFEEAHARTDRVLNIIISSPSEDVPNLMNYLTAPNVLIRSAALASHITNMARHRGSPIQLLYKDVNGIIRTLESDPQRTKIRRPPSAMDRKTPVTRLKQLFNVDHFIISQARPYVAPFVKPSLPYVRKPKTRFQKMTGPLAVIPMMFTESVKHGLLIADILGWLPDGIRRVLSDETVAGDSLTLVPEISLADWRRLLKNPTEEEVAFWMMRGQRSVWPALCALKTRCLLEFALDQACDALKYPNQKKYPPLLMGRLHASLTPPANADTPLLMLNSGSLADDASDDAYLVEGPERRRRKVPRLSDAAETLSTAFRPTTSGGRVEN
ncbi:Patatin-like phospholipase domain-containing [Lecanosticta acicola]|uniref:Patatin-like phospholipase domain-containing n=1 Tax=Lecanosticta acicola TaxID=111012 RepID=A0AAI9E9M4_9PEZI|nr:Patatin-like phospholipase domain-containing [Lecanosticta acicola]